MPRSRTLCRPNREGCGAAVCKKTGMPLVSVVLQPASTNTCQRYAEKNTSLLSRLNIGASTLQAGEAVALRNGLVPQGLAQLGNADHVKGSQTKSFGLKASDAAGGNCFTK